MLTSLFKPAWKSDSDEKRLSAIAAMNSANPEQQQILAQLAAEDTAAAVRIAAIQKLASVEALHELSKNPSDDAIRSAADKRIDQLIGAESTLSEAQYRDLINRFPDLTTRIAAHAAIPAIRTESIQGLPTDQLLDVAGSTVYTDTRQLIATRLSDIDDLESARKQLRGKDKQAERIVKTKIDEFRARERQQAENLAIVEKLCHEVEYLASHVWRPEFKAKLLFHRNQWDSLEFDIDPALIQRYQSARQVIDERYEQQKLIEETHQAQHALLEELEAFVQIIVQRDLKSSLDTLSETTQRQAQISASWQQLADRIQPDQVSADRYDSMLGALQSVIQLVTESAGIMPEPVTAQPATATGGDAGDAARLSKAMQGLTTALKKLKWPACYGELQLATELQQLLAGWRKAQQESAAAYDEKLAQLHKKISSIFRFSRAGKLDRARQLYHRAEKALQPFSGKDHAILQERLEEAQQTLGEMVDWQNYATEPKYIELCKSMERLAGSKLHPDKLSKQIKELQQQWKALGHSELSDQYWEQFKQAADKAYEPCASFFDERHKTRKVHLEQRQQLVEQMRQLLEATDWDNSPDYKVAQSSVRSISDSFNAIKDIERDAGQKQWKEFSRLKDEVYAKLDVAYEANASLKQQLIKQATALAEAAAKEENLGALKILQTRWKQVGVTRRNQDQKAWKEFKKQGDIVFNNVQALRQGHRDETDQQLNAYRAVIKDIQQLARTASDLAEADRLFADLQDRYTGLPELPEQLPEKMIESIQRDYSNACDQYDKAQSRIMNDQHRRQIDTLRMKASLCAQLEALGDSPSEKQRQEISSQWDANPLQNAELSRRIEKRLKSTQTPIDRTEIAAQRRLLCIQLEIATGAESPPEDKALRMQYQLEQMNKSGLGQQTGFGREQLEEMELEWLCMPGAEPKLQKALDKRFQRTLRPE